MKLLNKVHLLSWLVTLATFGAEPIAAISDYNISWKTPGHSSKDSMPIGNGDIGLNLWTEKSNELVFYVSKTDSWDDIGRLVKIGRVRITLPKNSFSKGFQQTLHIDRAEIVVKWGSNNSARIWVDANNPVIHVETNSAQAASLDVKFELWRKEYTMNGSIGHSRDETTVSDIYSNLTGPDIHPSVIKPDTIVTTKSNTLMWYHHNKTSGWRDTIKHQSLQDAVKELDLKDPLDNLVFGAVIEGNGVKKVSNQQLISKAKKNHHIRIHVLTKAQSSPEKWMKSIGQQVKQVNAKKATYRAHLGWWSKFWKRSWIKIGGKDKNAYTVARAYQVQRFMDACAGRGAQPIKFNGSIFTTEHDRLSDMTGGKQKRPDPDFRLWGPGYWFQNTRLIYWSKFMAGDFDLIQPFFKMYVDALPLRKFQTKKYYNHDGAWFPETLQWYGTLTNDNYGWNRNGKPLGYVEEVYTKGEIQGGMELVFMMIQYYYYTGDVAFLKEKAIPMFNELLTYYEQHYKVRADGFYDLGPLNALEMYWNVYNPTPDVAGLHANLEAMLAIDSSVTTSAQRKRWAKTQSKIVPIPMRTVKGKKIIGFAERNVGGSRNYQNPELQAIFPFKRYCVGKPQLEMAKETFDNRVIKGTTGWKQDIIHSAMLGKTETAKNYIIQNATTWNRSYRFPIFWGPNFDWTPDQDHGGNICIGLQRMLMQNTLGKIYLLPSWPKEWDTDFKLHAPGRTIIKGSVRNGKIVKLSVTPKSRRKDVVIPTQFK